MIKLKKLLLEADDKQIAANLDKAFKGGPVATRAYLNSPEGQDASLNSLLKHPGAEYDGDADDDKITVKGPSDISVDPSSIKPTQNFIDAMKSIAFPLGSAKALSSAITSKKGFGTIIVSGNDIIDGHHRWSGTLAITPDGSINALDVTWPGTNVKEKLASAQLAIAASMEAPKEQPSASGDVATDILGKGKEAVADIVMSNINKKPDPKAPGPLLNDEMMEILVNPESVEGKAVAEWLGQEITDVDQLRQAIANKVGENLESIQNPEEEIGRPDMPQFDPKVGGPDLNVGSDLLSKLKAGELNISPPFKKESRVIKLKDLLAEGKYDHHIGRWFDVNGKDWRIVRFIDDRFAHVMDDRKNSSMFRIEFLVKNAKALKPGGPDFSTKKQRPVRPKVMTKRDYEKMLKGAMEDTKGMMGDEEFTHDMASSMIHDPEIKKLLQKEYPMVRKEEDLIQRLQWDLETYD